MWWMTHESWKRFSSSQKGNTSIVVALMMVVLLGFAAISVDVGRLYWEKAQLQNGADAGALAVASACIKDPTLEDCANSSSIITTIASENANDGQSLTDEAVFGYASSGKKNSVTVTTLASETGATDRHVSTWFARVFGQNEVAVSASATAVWGSPHGTTSAFPLAFSFCEVDSTPASDGGLKFLQSLGGSDTDCTGPSGWEIPGGFGWLLPDTGTCESTTSIGGDPAASKPGGATNLLTQQVCLDVLEKWKKTLDADGTVTALFPVFEFGEGQGYGGAFPILAYAAIEIHGWKFTNGAGHDLLMYPRDPPHALFPTGGSKMGIVGKFVRYVFEDEAAEPGDSEFDFGAEIVRLTK